MTRDKLPLLSKSRFIGGLQCHKRLFLECYYRELADPIEPALQALFETGTAVGELARERFPGGHLIAQPAFAHAQAVTATEEVIANDPVSSIYEGAFTFDDVRVRADVLIRNGAGAFDLVEVKSSTRVHEGHIADAAIQLYVLEGAGVRVGSVGLLHIDNSYVYEGGAYDPDRLFRLEDISTEARSFAGSLAKKALADMRSALSRDEAPVIEIGRQCTRPYQCPFFGHCRIGMPEHHIEQLPSARDGLLQSLRAAEVRDIRDIPRGFPGLSSKHERVRESVVSGQPYVDPNLGAVLNRVAYPHHFLDFETFGPALPVYPGTRPFQTIPFQWSLHVREVGGALSHLSFLHEGDGDPREVFARSLLEAIKPEGAIIVYSSYEKTIVGQLAAHLPEYAHRLLSLGDRMVDLLEIIRRHYYHPNFHGSYSIKSVLPALVPDRGYTGLDIQDGRHASVAFQQLVAPDTTPDEKESLRSGLLAYCRQDTEAMAQVFDALC